MDPVEIRMILIVAAVTLGAAVPGYLLVRRGAQRWVFGLGAAALATGGWLMVKAQGAQGWDALAYFIIVLFFVAPALAGLAIGGGIAWWRHRRRR